MNWKEQRDRMLVHFAPRNHFVQIFVAETIGTFIVITFGTAAITQATFIKNSKSSDNDIFAISMCWGIGLFVAIFATRRFSGSHLNPAVTLAQAFRCQIPWKSVPLYSLAQILGAYLGAACVYGIYYDQINKHDGGLRAMTGINGTGMFFVTVPSPGVSFATLFADNVFNTALLMLGILAITDESNSDISSSLQPPLIGLLVAGIILTFGLNCGAAMNPVRDLGPRLFLFTVGYGQESFAMPIQNPDGELIFYTYFWIPIIGCYLGALVGAVIYDLFFHSVCKLNANVVELQLTPEFSSFEHETITNNPI